MSNVDGHGNMYVKNRKGMESKLNNDIDSGPVIEKNIADFDELKEIQTEFNRRLQKYNQSIQVLIENSRDYISASSTENNRFANTYLKAADGAIGYVTGRGVWKWIPNRRVANSMQGKNGCPLDWANAPSISPGDKEAYEIGTAPNGKIVSIDGTNLVKGSPTIMNQTCTSSGKNLYVTNPSRTTNRKYAECSQNQGSYQSDLGVTTLEACAKRAEDLGSNVFQMGKNEWDGRGKCYINGGGNTTNASKCPDVPGVGRMGSESYGRWNQTGNWWWGWNWNWIPGYKTFATYETTGAHIGNLGETYYISDDLTKKKYPDHLIPGYGNEFQQLRGYNSYGNDITSGSGLTLEQVKQKCLETPGAAGFYMSGDKYWIKNKNMWPKGKRQYTGGDLYIRNKKVMNNNSCSKTVDFTRQADIDGYVNSGYMDQSITCGLGTISKKDMKKVIEQLNKLNVILNTLFDKIMALSREDLTLNKRLLSEYKRMKDNLSKYESTYKHIKASSGMSSHFNALEEDSEIQMLSYNQKYILWSMLALGVTAGAMKIMK